MILSSLSKSSASAVMLSLTFLDMLYACDHALVLLFAQCKTCLEFFLSHAFFQQARKRFRRFYSAHKTTPKPRSCSSYPSITKQKSSQDIRPASSIFSPSILASRKAFLTSSTFSIVFILRNRMSQAPRDCSPVGVLALVLVLTTTSKRI